MFGKTVFVFCAQAFLIQSVFSQCTSRAAVEATGFPGAYGAYPSAYGQGSCAAASAYDGLYPNAGLTLECSPTSGGALPVSSISSYAPVGLSVLSQNAFEGVLAVTGELPFVGTTSLSGVVPSAGSGAINHACGNGVNTITAISDSSSPASVSALSSYGLTGSALNAPYAAPGLLANGFAANGLAANGYAANGWAANGLAAPALAYDGLCADGIEFTATSGGALPVSSASALPATGLAVASETVYEGPLTVAGELPFVGTVGLEGVLPTSGLSAVNHSCGNGRNVMISDGEVFGPAYGAYGAYAPAAAIAPAATISPAAGCGAGYNYPARLGGYGYAI